MLLSFSSVQSYLANRTTKYLNRRYKTNITIDKADFSYLGNVTLKKVLIRDHHKDSLIYVENLKTSILNFKNVIDSKLVFGAIDLSAVFFQIKTYKGEEEDALAIFVEKFDDKANDNDTPSNFLLTSSLVTISNGLFQIYDENKDGKPLVFKKINGKVSDFKIVGPNASGFVEDVSFLENHDVMIKKLTTNFSYTRQQMKFLDTKIATNASSLSGTILFNYQREDLADFNNKVNIDANFDKATIALRDLNKFYDGFGTRDLLFLSTKISGTLNNFTASNVRLKSSRNVTVNGVLNFKNVFDKGKEFSLNANFTKLSSDYNSLQSLLPTTLSKTVPIVFDKLGQFNLQGTTYISSEVINAKLNINTALGNVISDLKLTNVSNIDNASYVGHIQLNEFDLGVLVSDPLIGKLSLDADVDGKGFDLEHLNTSIKGNISKHQYKGYTYSNIDVNGLFQNKRFNGKLISHDENIQLTFKGKADFSSEIYKFDFKTDVGFANFNKLNLFKRDAKAILKGVIDIKATGNSLDNFAGNINFKNASYTNQRDTYKFTEFNINSSFKDSIRTITVDSPEIINGKLVGNFKFNELGILARNSLGSMYDNYHPFPVSKNQKLNFNLKIHNKIIGVFFPEIKLASKTILKGKIDADKDLFHLTFKSSQVNAFGNVIDKIRLQVDNKNPIFNSQLSIKDIKTKFYNASKLNLVTVNLQDTLFIRTEFTGGKHQTEKYNLALYHTIGDDNKSIFGVKKSDILINKTKWFLNASENNENKVVFDNAFTNFLFKTFSLTSGDQKITLEGNLKKPKSKDFNIAFENVRIADILPKIDSLTIKGLLNGKINYKQHDNKIIPTSDISVVDLYVNDYYQGNLTANLKGKNSLKSYDVNIELKNDLSKSFTVNGNVNFGKKTPTLDVDAHFEEYNLQAFGLYLGKDVFTNIRGYLYGDVNIHGQLKDPKMDGGLYLDSAGMNIPYLNVDYDFDGTTVVALEDHTFKIEDLTLLDKAKATSATVLGTIKHDAFKDWTLDLNLQTKNLLVLNTKEEENSLYYGTGFLKGDATIKGLTDKLVINVTGRTNPGTHFIVPLSDIRTAEKSSLVHFKAPKGKETINFNKDFLLDRFKGLSLNFNLAVTKDALVEMVIDESTGSYLKGRGTGDLLIEINTRGKFNMYGDFVIDNGIYDFKYGGIIDKEFVAKKGGTISWSGDPLGAELNIEAVYKLKANPRALLENYSGTRKIPVNLVTKITGELYHSTIGFDILMPNASTDIASELDFKLNRNDDNGKARHFIALLVTGSFLNDTNLNANANSFLYGTTSELISNTLSDIFNTGNDKVNIDIGYQVGEKGTIDGVDINDQIDLSLGTQLSDRIIINGKVGVPVGSKTQSTVVGEVEVEFLLNEEGTFRLKTFNRQNEIQYTDEEEGYTQGAGITYQVDFDNGGELLEKLGLKKKKTKDTTALIIQKKDTVKKKSFVRFK